MFSLNRNRVSLFFVVNFWVFWVFSMNLNADFISRNDFPDGFMFGTASSAYQVFFFFFENYFLVLYCIF